MRRHDRRNLQQYSLNSKFKLLVNSIHRGESRPRPPRPGQCGSVRPGRARIQSDSGRQSVQSGARRSRRRPAPPGRRSCRSLSRRRLPTQLLSCSHCRLSTVQAQYSTVMHYLSILQLQLRLGSNHDSNLDSTRTRLEVQVEVRAEIRAAAAPGGPSSELAISGRTSRMPPKA